MAHSGTVAGCSRSQVGDLGRHALGGAQKARLPAAYFASALAEDLFYLAWIGRHANLFVPAIEQERIARLKSRCDEAILRYVNRSGAAPSSWDSFEIAFIGRGGGVPLEVVCLNPVQTDWVPGSESDFGKVRLHVWLEAACPALVLDAKLEPF